MKNFSMELVNCWDPVQMLIPLWKRIGEAQQTTKDENSHLAILEKISWGKKSRDLQLKEGYNETNFFFICIENDRRNGRNH